MERDTEIAIEGGPGWHVDPSTLRPVIDDLEQFTSAHRDDPAVGLLTLLWTGRAEEAEAAIEQAWWLRVAAGAEEALVESSWRAAGRAAEEAARDENG